MKMKVTVREWLIEDEKGNASEFGDEWLKYIFGLPDEVILELGEAEDVSDYDDLIEEALYSKTGFFPAVFSWTEETESK
jgi:hypothetical protein